MQDTIQMLLVEDDSDDAERVCRELGKPGRLKVEVRQVSSLHDAQQSLAESHFDMVLTDLNLPDRRGIETYECIQKVAGHVPVIILSGANEADLSTRAVQAGAKDYLLKQIDTRPISYAVERWHFETVTSAHARQQFALASLGQHVLAGAGTDAILENAVGILADTLQVELCAIVEKLPKGTEGRIRSAVGCDKQFLGATIPLENLPLFGSTEPLIFNTDKGESPIL